MNNTPSDPAPSNDSWLQSMRNWVSLAGLILILASVFSFLLLFLIDTVAGSTNPYVGILTYLVAPAFSTLGVAITVLGIFLQRRRLIKSRGGPISLVIDFNRPRHRRILGLVGARQRHCFSSSRHFGSYHSYQFTESVTFCGQACHTVMEPEMVTYLNSPMPASPASIVTSARAPPGSSARNSPACIRFSPHLLDTYPRPVPTPSGISGPPRTPANNATGPTSFRATLCAPSTIF
jgi:hypothetical protein